MKVPPTEHILVDSYARLCQGLVGVHYCHTEHVPEFFKTCDKPTVLVSSGSDYSLFLQDEAHPNADLFKLANSYDWGGVTSERGRYFQANIGPACVPEKCDPKHRYSLKTDRFTWATFDDIPENVVRWFTTNPNVRHPKVEWIPFGVNSDGNGFRLLEKYAGKPKTKLLYVNFQDNSLERLALKGYFSGQNWVTFRKQANLPVGEYLSEMAEHKFVLSPWGCGLDCYRTYEALYLGCIPVIPASNFSEYLKDARLPVVTYDDPRGLMPHVLSGIYGKMFPVMSTYDYSLIMLSYWRDRIRKEAEKL